MRSPFDILEAYERRSLAHAVQLPERQFAQDLWRGVGYRVGQRRLVSDFREVVEIVPMPPVTPDRKSTRLNSSHSQISYAVFCLKKKKKTREAPSVHTPTIEST